MTVFKEENFALPTKDGKTIYGILTRATTPTDKVIIIAHGLTGHICEYIHMMAKDFFAQNGYDVVRLSFYSAEDDARNLEETTVQIQADDMNVVCDHYRTSYKELYCTGHSYGGTTLLLANPKAQAFSFWDASFYPLAMHWKDRTQLEGTEYYTTGWGTTALICKAMYDEAFTLDTKAFAKKIVTPSHIALAGNNVENKQRTALYDELSCEKSLDDIEGADHCFTVGNTIDELLNKTLAWFEEH